MNERAATQAAFHANMLTAAQTRLPSWRTTCLIACAVLFVHVWLFASSSLWITPNAEQPLQTKAFTTRQIQLPIAQSAVAPANPKTKNTSIKLIDIYDSSEINTTTDKVYHVIILKTK